MPRKRDVPLGTTLGYWRWPYVFGWGDSAVLRTTLTVSLDLPSTTGRGGPWTCRFCRRLAHYRVEMPDIGKFWYVCTHDAPQLMKQPEGRKA